MSVAEVKAGLKRLGLTEKHIASKTGLDLRTVKAFLDSGKGRFSTEQAVLSAYRELVLERSEKQVSPQSA